MPKPVNQDTRYDAWLVGGGEMGKLLRSMDWSKTPLGPIESWPQSLRTTVSLCLASNFPISLAWGPGHVQIYNDGYWPICGGKHPHSMGQDFSECWASAWPVIGDAFEGALQGTTSYLENQRMFLDRNGYLEETFFTFSFSPIRDETGGVGGLFHPVTETTVRMLSERRTRALRDLAARTGKAQTIEEVCTLAAVTLADYPLDLPFVLFYVVDASAGEARLAASVGLPEGTAASPSAVALDQAVSVGWPLAEVVRSSQARHMDDLTARFGELVCGPYPEPLKDALALPVTPPGHDQAIGVIVAGISSRLPLNEAYRAYYDFLAAGVTTAVANARAREQERKRVEALEEIDKAKTAFFSNVSHEFRTPLTLLMGPIEDELAESGSSLPAARRERLEIAHRNSLRLLKLVNTLLDFSRIEAGRAQACFEPTDLSKFTAELASVFRSAIEKAGLQLTIDCMPLVEPVYVDHDMWEKIVLNLLSNALKHTFAGGVYVGLKAGPGQVVLTVKDSGVGVPKESLPRLFDRFHRVKGARSRTHEGSGIGLALVRELVDMHGGTIAVESEEDKGTTFTVTLKTGTAHLAAADVHTGPPHDMTGQAQAFVEEALRWLPNAEAGEIAEFDTNGTFTVPAVTGAPARPRILWVDDNADMRDYVERLLDAHYDVTAAGDGLAALAAAQQDPPDLVLSDVMMPRLDGFGLLRELRNDERTRTIPVILLSARAGEESAIEGLDAGADDYLAKPFSARELLARVRTHLELARARREWSVQLERVNKELERARAAKDSFLASMSHELRTPLNAIIGFTGILLMKLPGQLTEAQERHLTTIQKSAKHLLSLVSDLLDLAKIEAGKLTVHMESVCCQDVLQESISSLRPLAEAKSIAFESSLPAEPVMIHTDRRALSQIVLNITNNAIKFTPQGSVRLELAGASRDGAQFAAIHVVDTGIGIKPEDKEKLFGSFQRLNEESRVEGTGLGLYLSGKLVELIGGHVEFESDYGRGSRFTVLVPRA